MTTHEDESERAVSALARGDFNAYRGIVKELPHGDGAAIWTHVASAHPERIDLFDALLAMGQGEDTERAFRYLLPPISLVRTAKANEFRKLLEFAGRLGMSYQSSIARWARPLVSGNPSLGSEVGQTLAPGSTDQALSVWSIAFAMAAPLEAALYAVRLLESSEIRVALLAALVNSLRDLSAEASDVLLVHEVRLVEVFLNSEPELKRQAWAVLDAMSSYSPLATQRLVEGARAHNPLAVSVLSVALYLFNASTFGASRIPTADLVSILFDAALTNPALRKPADDALAELMRPDEIRVLVLNEMLKFGQTHLDVYETFPGIVNELLRRPTELARLVTGWLLSSGLRLAPLRSLLIHVAAHEGTVIRLDADSFSAALPPAQVKVVRRLLLATPNGTTLLAFAKSLIEDPGMGEAGLHYGQQLLALVGKDYPASTLKFLRSRLETAEAGGIPQRVYRHHLEAAEKWEVLVEALPKLKELEPATEHALALRAVHLRRQRQISRLSKDGDGLLAALFTSVHIAQGDSFVVDGPGGQQTIAKMQPHALFLEVPLSERADPVGRFVSRLNLEQEAE